MNQNFSNDEDKLIHNFLNDLSEKTNANPQFVAELEKTLKAAHRPQTRWQINNWSSMLPSIGWAVLVIVFALAFSWSIPNLIPDKQPAAEASPTTNPCPVTQPNGIAPPGENPSDDYYSNGELWTVLWPDGKVVMSTFDYNKTDGSYSMKWGWWRGVSGQLTIEGHRLDAEAEPLRADIPDGYGDSGFQVSGLIFPTTGCWEVAGRVGESTLTFVTEVIAGQNVPTPEPSINATPDANSTPVVIEGGYDWRGTKLFLVAPLPNAPTEASLYLLKEDPPISIEQTLALAERFGVQGNVYVDQNPATGATEYFITDGKQSISAQTEHFYTYTANMARAFSNLGGRMNPNAETAINEFLTSHMFDFPFKFAGGEFFGGYTISPLSPDGYPMRYEFFSSRPLKVILDENGQVLQAEANLMNYVQVGTQPYQIISADEAFSRLLDDTVPGGKIESALSSSLGESQEWRRAYPSDETITIYGYASSIPALDPSQPAFVQIDGFTTSGNNNGMDRLKRNTFVEATGQFIEENGISKFNIDSWQESPFLQDGIVGTITRENGQVIIDTDQGEHLILQPEIPADVPLPYENAFVVGVRKGVTYDWTLIDNRFALGGGGGGGGGGQGFYKLNLSGTPVPFPPPVPTPGPNDGFYIVQEGDTLVSISTQYGISVEQIAFANGLSNTNTIYIGQQLVIPGAANIQELRSDIVQKIEGLRGTVSVEIYQDKDGNQRIQNSFISIASDGSYLFYILEGADLRAYQNKVLKISGTLDRSNNNFNPVIKIDQFEDPYPDAHFEILQGTQYTSQVNGKDVTIFVTDDGRTFAEQNAYGEVFASMFGDNRGKESQLEVLILPDEYIGSYPALRVFSGVPVTDTQEQLQISADQIPIIEEAPDIQESYTPPALTIEKVELMYYVTNPNWQVDHLDGNPLYIQPVWRFYGHYDNGGEFDVIIQAIKQEYLLPEFDTFIPGG